MRLAAARCARAAGIQDVGDCLKCKEPRILYLPHYRKDIAGKLIGGSAVCGMRLRGWRNRSGIAELGAAAFLAASAVFVRAEISARSFSARAAYRWSMNGSASAPSPATMNGTLVRHQAADEMHVAADPRQITHISYIRPLRSTAGISSLILVQTRASLKCRRGAVVGTMVCFVPSCRPTRRAR
jgi:hypothetical protein